VYFLPGNQLSVDYRYPIFHRESKRKILLKGFDLIIKAISQQFLCPDTYGVIAEITTEPERTGIDDIKRFFGS
jgi:hypothetical protein